MRRRTLRFCASFNDTNRAEWSLLDELGISDLSANDDGLFSAGQVFKNYRRSKGTGKKDGVLPDFMIGAVAEAKGVALITLNDRDFVNKFESLAVVNPVKS
jgi:predicted nucleic acid-binding protein